MTERHDFRTFIHRVDSNDIIVYVNDDWLSFAMENGAPHLSRDAVVGHSLWEFIEDMETRWITRTIMTKLRRSGATLTIPFRCDSPDMRRYMEMDLISMPNGGVEFICRLLKVERRSTVNLLKASTKRSEAVITMCSWCKKIRIGGDSWVEVEDAVRDLELFATSRLPQLSHGMCPSCSRLFIEKRG